MVLQALKDHPKHTDLAMVAVSRVCECASPEDELVEDFADEMLNKDDPLAWAAFEPLLECLAEGTNRSNAARRIELLCNKLRTIDHLDLGMFEWNFGGFIVDIARDPPYPSRTSALLVGLIGVLAKASESLSASEIMDALQRLPSSLSRVRSWVLAESVGDGCALPVAEVERAIESRFPTGDDMRLIDRILERCEPSTYTNPWRGALGPAPKVEEVGRALAASDVPREWNQKRAWVALLPTRFALRWSAICDVLDARYGQITRDDFERFQAQVIEVGMSSPISIEELRSLDPETAADKIREWRPDPNERPSRVGDLGQALASVVAENISGWATNPLRIVTKLRQPVYIESYLSALASAGSDPRIAG